MRLYTIIIVLGMTIGLSGCASYSASDIADCQPATRGLGLTACLANLDIAGWEKTANIPKLTEVTRNPNQPQDRRILSFEALGRLNWKPTKREALDAFRPIWKDELIFARVVQSVSSVTDEEFSEIDARILDVVGEMDGSGRFVNAVSARKKFDELLKYNGRAVTLSLCMLTIAHREIQTKMLLLGIKLGIPNSEFDLGWTLVTYIYDKSLAEDYLNSGSDHLALYAQAWAIKYEFQIFKGAGSSRAGWARF